jgi:hypothetical protein
LSAAVITAGIVRKSSLKKAMVWPEGRVKQY